MRIKYYLTTFLTLLFVSSLTFAQTSFTWKTVGTTGFSDGAIQYSSIVIDSSGTPSVAYVDGGAPGSGYADYPKVRKFNGTGWANAAPNVIDNNMSDNTTWNTSLAVDSGGKLYLAFKDVYKTGKITVKSDNNGVAWGNVGQQGFTPGSVEYISLAVNSSGTPYVAYQDGANSSKASVMKWTGTGWSNVGTAGFSAGNANFTSLAFDNSGTPYLAFQDLANS